MKILHLLTISSISGFFWSFVFFFWLVFRVYQLCDSTEYVPEEVIEKAKWRMEAAIKCLIVTAISSGILSAISLIVWTVRG